MKKYVLFSLLIAVTGSSCEKPQAVDRSCSPSYGLRYYLDSNDECYSIDLQGKRKDEVRTACTMCQ